MAVVETERHGQVLVVKMNRPERLNALNHEIRSVLAETWTEFRESSDLEVAIFTGNGRAFCAGEDMKESLQDGAPGGRRPAMEDPFMSGALEKPVIAAINGFALGGGCELAMSCDWIYASTKARFGQPEVKLGLIPGFGGTSRLVRRVGVAWAKELVCSGVNLKADEAQRIGLVNRVFEPEDLLARSLEAAQTVAANGPVAVRLAKRVIQQGQDADVRTAHALEQNAFGLVFASDEHSEGMQAFLEKRDPEFLG